MFSNCFMSFRPDAKEMNPFGLCLLISLTVLQASRAEDESTKANSMLNSLKQRSAAERWQRVKKQYPAETAVPRPNVAAAGSQSLHPELPDEEVPPTPADGFSVPRLSVLPGDDSDDWIRPARPLIVEEEAKSPPKLAAVPQAAESTAGPAAPPADAEETPAPGLTMEDPATTSVDKESQSSRTPIERVIGSISPYYDRDRDADIRKFAVEKAKEFNIDFKTREYEPRSFPEITLAWQPTNFYYYPLYFEDPALERYGHTYAPAIQPIASIARFGAQVVLLPYQMTIIPPGKAEYPLGYYRPGEYAPKLHYQIPLNAQAAVVEAAAVTGFFFLIQ